MLVNTSPELPVSATNVVQVPEFSLTSIWYPITAYPDVLDGATQLSTAALLFDPVNAAVRLPGAVGMSGAR